MLIIILKSLQQKELALILQEFQMVFKPPL